MAERLRLQSRKRKVLLGYNYLLKSNKKTKSLNRAINSPENSKMVYSQRPEQREIYKKEYLDELIKNIKNSLDTSIDPNSKEDELMRYFKFLHLRYEGNPKVIETLKNYEQEYIKIQIKKSYNYKSESENWPKEFKELVTNVCEVMKGIKKEGYPLEDSYKFAGPEGDEIREEQIKDIRKEFCLVKS